MSNHCAVHFKLIIPNVNCNQKMKKIEEFSIMSKNWIKVYINIVSSKGFIAVLFVIQKIGNNSDVH